MLLAGALSGWAGMAMLSAGQKFPQAVADVSWRAAETMVPCAVGIEDADISGVAALFRKGTHLVLTVVLPACVLLFLTAPALVTLWLGSSIPITISIVRWTSVAVVLDAIGLTAIQVLWGKGHAILLLWLHIAASAVCLAVTALLVPRIGITGAAIGLIGSALVASLGALTGIRRICRFNVLVELKGAISGLVFPIFGLLGSVILFSRWLNPDHGAAGYLGLCAASVSVYLALLILFGIDDDVRKYLNLARDRFLIGKAQ